MRAGICLSLFVACARACRPPGIIASADPRLVQELDLSLGGFETSVRQDSVLDLPDQVSGKCDASHPTFIIAPYFPHRMWTLLFSLLLLLFRFGIRLFPYPPLELIIALVMFPRDYFPEKFHEDFSCYTFHLNLFF